MPPGTHYVVRLRCAALAGECCVPLLACLFPNWRTFTALCGASVLLALFTAPWIPESPRWLLSQVCRQVALGGDGALHANVQVLQLNKQALTCLLKACCTFRRGTSCIKGSHSAWPCFWCMQGQVGTCSAEQNSREHSAAQVHRGRQWHTDASSTLGSAEGRRATGDNRRHVPRTGAAAAHACHDDLLGCRELGILRCLFGARCARRQLVRQVLSGGTDRVSSVHIGHGGAPLRLAAQRRLRGACHLHAAPCACRALRRKRLVCLHSSVPSASCMHL
jgi:hypothetical protein